MDAARRGSIHYRGQELDGADLMGVTTNMAVISNIPIDRGRFLTDFEDQRRMSVAFIGNDVVERFFLDRDPVGKTIAVSGKPFQVIGAAKKRGSAFGQSRDKFAIIPVNTVLTTFGARPELELA